MSLIHYVKPFLELGICKEYSMPRKTTGNTTPKRSKKTAVPVEPAAAQVAPEVQLEVQTEARKEFPRNGKTANVVPGNGAVHPPVNIEEEIRRRAYELYLQRGATAGAGHGDENQDWLIAESEILSRYDKLARHTTA